MFKFSEFLVEAKEPSKRLDHINHLEDHIIKSGHQGVNVAANHLDDVHNALLGKKTNSTITTKYDGAPSIVFGIDPENGQFFVGTKSVFNKNRKINYSPEDIKKNHSNSEELVNKLINCLNYLPKIMPKSGGVFQADYMYDKDSVQKVGQTYQFTPNTITYSVGKNTSEGKSIKNSIIGIVVHTKYVGKTWEDMQSSPIDNSNRVQFINDPEVYNIDPTIYTNPESYSEEEQKDFLNHKESARLAYTKVDPAAMEAIYNHSEPLLKHINKSVKEAVDPSAEGFIQHLYSVHNKSLNESKLVTTKKMKQEAHDQNMKYVLENIDHFKNILSMHGHLQNAKNVLVDVLAKNTKFEHYIDGIPTTPEGAVITDKKGNVSKLINRKEFSRKNLNGFSKIESKKNGI